MITNCDMCNIEVSIKNYRLKQNVNDFVFCSIACSSYHRIYNIFRQVIPRKRNKRINYYRSIDNNV